MESPFFPLISNLCFIFSQKIDELRKDITLCENIENRALKTRDDIKEINQEIKVKIKNKNRDIR